MLTMQEIRSKNYRIFAASLGAEMIAKQESALKYLEHLANITSTDISKWTPMQIFANSEGHLYRERNKLNELFFAYREHEAAKVPEPTAPAQTITDKEAEQICFKFDQSFTKSIDTLIAKQQRTVDSSEADIQSYSQVIREKQEVYFKACAMMDGLKERKKNGLSLAGDLKKILAEGWWRLSDDPTSNAISLITQPIRLTHVNEKQAVSLSVEMGVFQLDVTLGSNGVFLQAKVVRYDMNPTVDSYIHPHIAGRYGDVCFGNMQNAFTAASTAFNLYEICEIMKKVLTSYNSESPYVALHRLEEAARMGKVFRRAEVVEKKKALRRVIEENRFTAPLELSPAAAAGSDAHAQVETSTGSGGIDRISSDEFAREWVAQGSTFNIDSLSRQYLESMAQTPQPAPENLEEADFAEVPEFDPEEDESDEEVPF